MTRPLTFEHGAYASKARWMQVYYAEMTGTGYLEVTEVSMSLPHNSTLMSPGCVHQSLTSHSTLDVQMCTNLHAATTWIVVVIVS